eukprot:m.51958 g.51958  ORF g.51958 m.51958 type:complete len:74 (-) comp48393_c0_seq2:148-369(-)
MSQKPEVKADKLRKQNEQLRLELTVRRIPVSEAAAGIKSFCNDTKDPLVPSVWGKVDDRDNRYIDKKKPCIIL